MSTCLLAVEWDRWCQEVYRRAFPSTPLVGDVRSITRRANTQGSARDATSREIRSLVPDHDVLFAGFPCQPFSKGGQQDGLLDPTQGTLFHDIVAITRAVRPRVLCLENVANLVGHDEGNTWSVIKSALIDLAYQLDETPLVISPHQLREPYGSPHHRRRVFIVATDRKAALPPPLNSSEVLRFTDLKSVPWTIHSILDADAQSLDVSSREQKWLDAWDEFVRLIPDEKLPTFPIWVDSWTGRMRPPTSRRGSGASVRRREGRAKRTETSWWERFDNANREFFESSHRRSILQKWLTDWEIQDFPESRRKFEWQATAAQPTRRERSLRKLLIQLRPSGIRVRPPTYAPALVAMAQTPIVGTQGGWRRLGPREAARLQNFPNYRPWQAGGIEGAEIPDAIAYRQMGNAVNVGVARFIIERTILPVLGTASR